MKRAGEPFPNDELGAVFPDYLVFSADFDYLCLRGATTSYSVVLEEGYNRLR